MKTAVEIVSTKAGRAKRGSIVGRCAIGLVVAAIGGRAWAAPEDKPAARDASKDGAVSAGSVNGGTAKPGDKSATTKPGGQATASSLIEDRAARKLLAAGDARLAMDQSREALELFQQVVERYPRSVVRFEAFMRMGKYYLEKAHDPTKALPYFERSAVELNEDTAIRGEAMLMVGRSYYDQSKWQQAFASLRLVTIQYPGTEFSNQAYFYIGNAHYKLGAYSRAIEAFGKVGTAISDTDLGKKYMEIGKRMFVRVSDLDLTALQEGSAVTATVTSSSGDSETVKLSRVGPPNSPNYLGELDTTLGEAVKEDGMLQVLGSDKVMITYMDAQTASKELNIARKTELQAVHNGIADFMDGAFRDPLKTVVVGKTAYLRVIDLDRDISPKPDTVQVKVVAKRLVKKASTTLPVAADAADAAKKVEGAEVPKKDASGADILQDDDELPVYKVIDEVTLTLGERPREGVTDSGAMGAEKPKSMHTGVFGNSVPILPGTAVAGDGVLQVEFFDRIEVQYMDEINSSGKPREVIGVCTAVDGALADVKASDPNIDNIQLELQTRLKKAEALTNIGRIYKQLGLKEQAVLHFRQGISECDALDARARNLGGEVLETLYVRLWKLYLELDELDQAAKMCLQLQKDFPNSQFVDEALLGLGETSLKKGDAEKAISIFKRVLDLPVSARKADALYQIGLCQEQMAQPKAGTSGDAAKPNQKLMESAFLSYQQVFQRYPTSGVAGDAVGKMADYYLAAKDYDRAISTLQQALDEYPDAQFTDRILYDFGRSLYRMQRTDEALAKFRQLLSEYPQSKWASKVKPVIASLEKRGKGD